MSYRHVPSTEGSGFSPYHMLFGQEMRLPIDTALIPRHSLATDHKAYLSHILRQLVISRNIANENIKRAQNKYKTQFDKKASKPQFQITDRVWLKVMKVKKGKSPKLCKKYVGPYFIQSIASKGAYQLRRISDNVLLPSHVNGQGVEAAF
ncbi:uncharacterized protein LOC141907783 [Tubulanus polymorphus]|uniref:uncharacterized protein LOC141907783 n=1 Tax=Tubulanus polymorphus TaxID=672921 RepID=UPI003DA64CD9